MRSGRQQVTTNDGQQVGKITKHRLSDMDIRFPLDLDVKLKAVILCACILIVSIDGCQMYVFCNGLASFLTISGNEDFRRFVLRRQFRTK